MRRAVWTLLLAICVGAAWPAAGHAHHEPCPRPVAGSAITPPPELVSAHGVLKLAFDYYTTVDEAGRTLFCFTTPSGEESPTLRINPGDRIDITLTNKVAPPPPGIAPEIVSNSTTRCGDTQMLPNSVNMHFHGTNTSPTCHSDEVIHTIINYGQTFQYSLQFPANEPPGLYWYHPHIHGIASPAVQGGASGVIIVDGVGKLQPAVRGLPERILVIRDQNVPGHFVTAVSMGGGIAGGASAPRVEAPTPTLPSWDISLNYVPIPYPNYPPAVIKMKPGAREFWRVANASADTIMDLQLLYDGVAQPFRLVSFDGVPIGSQDGTRRGTIITQTDILIPPAGRAEFIVDGPSTKVKQAIFQTLGINTGPLGDSDPPRPLAVIQVTPDAPTLRRIPDEAAPPGDQRFEGLAKAAPTTKRTLYFSEVLVDPNNPNGPVNFFITVDGQTPTLFDPNNPPAIITKQGAVEDWTIENRSQENHEFHMHQIHFLLREVNGVAVPTERQQFYDTYQVPFWTGSGPYPSITVRMDFRGAVVGDFVYHCHILDHEDGGMMAIIRVNPRP